MSTTVLSARITSTHPVEALARRVARADALVMRVTSTSMLKSASMVCVRSLSPGLMLTKTDRKTVTQLTPILSSTVYLATAKNPATCARKVWRRIGMATVITAPSVNSNLMTLMTNQRLTRVKLARRDHSLA